MSTRFTPDVTPTTRIEMVEKQVVEYSGFPEVGTLIRATLGDTVVVGAVHEQTYYGGGPSHGVIYVTPNGIKRNHQHLTLWLDSGWEFELLDDEALASVAA